MRSARSASHSSRIDRDISQLEELAARIAPAQRLDDRTGLAIGKKEAVVAVEGVGLQNAGVAGQMPLGLLPPSIARGLEQLASPAREPFPEGLDHLPPAGTTSSVSVMSSPSFDSFSNRSRGTSQGPQSRSTLAAEAQGTASARPSGFKGFDNGRGRRLLRHEFLLGRVCLGVLQLRLQLVEKPFLAFRARATKRALEGFRPRA
jgi:hypothetical protein